MDPTYNQEEKGEERLLARCLFVLAKISCEDKHKIEDGCNSFHEEFYNFL